MKNKTTALVALLAAVSAVVPAHADAPPTPSVAEKPMIQGGTFENVEVLDLLKVVAKIFKADVTIDRNVGGTLSFFRVSGRSAKEVLDQLATAAKLTVTEKDGTYIIRRAVSNFPWLAPQQVIAAPAPNVSADQFRIQLSMAPQPFYAADSLEAKLKLEVKPGTPEIGVAWNQDTLQLSIIALKDNSWVPVLKSPAAATGMPNPFRTPNRWPNFVNEDQPLSLSFDLAQWLEKPLEPGKYLCFVTYKSQATDWLFEDSQIWEGQLVSNAVQFEVPSQPIGQL